MHPTLLTIPLIGLKLPAYGTALMIGFLLAVWMARRRSRVLGLEPVEILDMGMFSIIGGVLGARVLYIVLFPHQFFSGWSEMSFLRWLGESFVSVISTWRGGLAYYGGLVGGIFALAWYARRRKIPLVDALDFAAAPAAVGLAVTRVGCFLNGCCFGTPSHLPWAVQFPPKSPAQELQQFHDMVGPKDPSLPVHPAQLYEMLFGLMLAAFIWFAVYPQRKFAGQAACTFGVLYATWRFSNEFLRGDTFVNGPGGAGLSSFQWMSLALIAVFATAYAVARRVGRAPFVPPPPEPEKAP